jgi:hypothetical protein
MGSDYGSISQNNGGNRTSFHQPEAIEIAADEDEVLRDKLTARQTASLLFVLEASKRKVSLSCGIFFEW